jgi:hypothetical protein
MAYVCCTVFTRRAAYRKRDKKRKEKEKEKEKENGRGVQFSSLQNFVTEAL